MNPRILALLPIIPMFCFGTWNSSIHDINNWTFSVLSYSSFGYKKPYFNSPTTILETEKTLPPRQPIITLQVYPNPIVYNAKISFSLAQPGIVTIKLYNIAGQMVKNIFNGYKPAGDYKMNLDIKGFTQGAYFLRIETPTETLSRSLVILR